MTVRWSESQGIRSNSVKRVWETYSDGDFLPRLIVKHLQTQHECPQFRPDILKSVGGGCLSGFVSTMKTSC